MTFLTTHSFDVVFHAADDTKPESATFLLRPDGRFQQSIDGLPTPGCTALITLLVDSHGMKSPEDFKTCGQYEHIGWHDSVTVSGSVNVILALKTVLFSPCFHYPELVYKKETILSRYNEKLINAISDPNLTQNDLERISPLAERVLNTAFVKLREKCKWVGSDGDFYHDARIAKHKFYQLVRLIWINYKSAEAVFQNKGFFERWKQPKPDSNPIMSILEEFKNLGLFPNGFLKENEHKIKTLDIEKLAKDIAREEVRAPSTASLNLTR